MILPFPKGNYNVIKSFSDWSLLYITYLWSLYYTFTIVFIVASNTIIFGMMYIIYYISVKLVAHFYNSIFPRRSHGQHPICFLLVLLVLVFVLVLVLVRPFLELLQLFWMGLSLWTVWTQTKVDFVLNCWNCWNFNCLNWPCELFDPFSLFKPFELIELFEQRRTQRLSYFWTVRNVETVGTLTD